MKPLGPGVRVRYLGQKHGYKNVVLMFLVGRTGVIQSRSTVPGMDWFVAMDEGAYDLDAAASALVPIDDDEADCWSAEVSNKAEHECVGV